MNISGHYLDPIQRNNRVFLVTKLWFLNHVNDIFVITELEVGSGCKGHYSPPSDKLSYCMVDYKSVLKRRNTLGCIDQWTWRGLGMRNSPSKYISTYWGWRPWNIRDCEAVYRVLKISHACFIFLLWLCIWNALLKFGLYILCNYQILRKSVPNSSAVKCVVNISFNISVFEIGSIKIHHQKHTTFFDKLEFQSQSEIRGIFISIYSFTNSKYIILKNESCIFTSEKIIASYGRNPSGITVW